jgi:flavodoxin
MRSAALHAIVIYDSQFGNTEQVAQVVARGLGSFGAARAAHVHETAVTQLRDVDLLVFGCPTQAWNAGSPMRVFVERLPGEVLRGPKIACFDTRLHVPRLMARFGAPQLEKHLKKMGIQVCAPSAGFYVVERKGPLQAGEIERATRWAKSVGEAVASGLPRVSDEQLP